MDTLDNPQIVDPKTVSPFPIATRYGLIASLILVAVGLAFYLGGFVDMSERGGAANWISNIVNWAVMIGASVLAIRKHRDEELAGYISFGRAFTTGFLVNLIIAVVSLIWTYVFFSFVAPELIEQIVEKSMQQMSEQRGMSEEDIEKSMGMMKWMFSPLFFSISAGIAIALIGAIISLITAAIMKKPLPQSSSI